MFYEKGSTYSRNLICNLYKDIRKLSLPSIIHDMEEDEGIPEGKNKGKQNMLIGKDEELSKWTHLPSDILEMIVKRLKLKDYLQIRAVCSPWRATITEAIANKHCHPLPELPLIFLKSQKESIMPSRFFSIKTEKECSLKSKSTLLPESHHLYHGMVEGWMILSVYHFYGTSKVISFLNPVTNEVVIVPSLLNFPSNSPILNRSNLNMGRMVASSSPRCEECVLVGLFTDFAHIAYCRVNSHKSWTMIKAKREDTGNFLDVEIFYGKLYVRTDRLSTMLVYNLLDSIDDPPKPKVLGMIPPIKPLPESSRLGNQIHVKGNVIRFLTRGYASGELLLIYLFNNYVYEAGNVGYINIIQEYVSPPNVNKCEVFKLDTSNNKWVKLDHLDDRVIFVGYYESFVMSRTSLNSAGELITENSVYFALQASHSKSWLGTKLGRLCLTDNNIKYFSLEQYGDAFNAYPLWFLPNA